MIKYPTEYHGTPFKPCPSGTHRENSQVTNTNTNATSSTPYPKDTFSTRTGLVSSRFCHPCLSNTISSPNSTACLPCPSTHLAVRDPCITCPAGTFITNPYSPACEPCNKNTYSSSSNILFQCTSCPINSTTKRIG